MSAWFQGDNEIACSLDSVAKAIDDVGDYFTGVVSLITVNSHATHQFTKTNNGVTHRLAVRDVTAPGLLGFFYRKFGSSKIGKALITAEKTHLEASVN